MELFFILIGIVLLGATTWVYDEYISYIDKIKNEVKNDYQCLMKNCEHDPQVLGWVSTINDRFERFTKTKEYITRQPYDKFKLTIPHKYYCKHFAYIAVDKKLNLKFVVNFEPSKHDDGRSDAYLKYAISYGDELVRFIKECENNAMHYSLEKNRVSKIENIINK